MTSTQYVFGEWMNPLKEQNFRARRNLNGLQVMNITNIVTIINFSEATLKTLTEAWKCRLYGYQHACCHHHDGGLPGMFFPFSSCCKEMGRLMYRSPVVEGHICYESNETIRVEIGEQLPLKAPEDRWELFPHSLGEHIWRFARLQV